MIALKSAIQKYQVLDAENPLKTDQGIPCLVRPIIAISENMTYLYLNEKIFCGTEYIVPKVPIVTMLAYDFNHLVYSDNRSGIFLVDWNNCIEKRINLDSCYTMSFDKNKLVVNDKTRELVQIWEGTQNRTSVRIACEFTFYIGIIPNPFFMDSNGNIISMFNNQPLLHRKFKMKNHHSVRYIWSWCSSGIIVIHDTSIVLYYFEPWEVGTQLDGWIIHEFFLDELSIHKNVRYSPGHDLIFIWDEEFAMSVTPSGWIIQKSKPNRQIITGDIAKEEISTLSITEEIISIISPPLHDIMKIVNVDSIKPQFNVFIEKLKYFCVDHLKAINMLRGDYTQGTEIKKSISADLSIFSKEQLNDFASKIDECSDAQVRILIFSRWGMVVHMQIVYQNDNGYHMLKDMCVSGFSCQKEWYKEIITHSLKFLNEVTTNN